MGRASKQIHVRCSENQVFALPIPRLMQDISSCKLCERLIILDSIFSLNPVVHHSCIANEHAQALEQPTVLYVCIIAAKGLPCEEDIELKDLVERGKAHCNPRHVPESLRAPKKISGSLGYFQTVCFWEDQLLNVFQISIQSDLYDTFKWRWMNVLHELHLWIDKGPKSKSLIPRVSAAVSAKVCTGWKAFHCQMWRLASVPWPNGFGTALLNGGE